MGSVEETIERVAAALRRRAARGVTDGHDTPWNARYIESCRVVHQPTASVVVFTRDIGHHMSGWMKNPDYERCLHLSLSRAPEWLMSARGGLPGLITGLQITELTPAVERLWCRALFGDAARYAWMESAKSRPGIASGVRHWRVFCDPSWSPILPRGEVYSTDFTEKGWRSAGQVWAEDGVLVQVGGGPVVTRPTAATTPVVHWWNLCDPSPTCACGYSPVQGREERQTSSAGEVTCVKCLHAMIRSACLSCHEGAIRRLAALRRTTERSAT